MIKNKANLTGIFTYSLTHFYTRFVPKKIYEPRYTNLENMLTDLPNGEDALSIPRL